MADLTFRDRRRWLGVLLLAGWVGVLPLAARPLEAADESVVPLVVDYGDGVEKRFTQIAWKDGMTVLDALLEAQKHPRGIQIKYRGKGATAFVSQIDELTNEANGRAWLFRVNDKLSERSCGISKLQPGDVVLWTFEAYR